MTDAGCGADARTSGDDRNGIASDRAEHPRRLNSATGQSPAPGTNATDVTSPPRRCKRRRMRRDPGPDRNHHHGDQARRESPERADQRAGAGTRKLDQLNISNFEQYTKQLPSVTFQTVSPATRPSTCAALRAGGDGNHSGSLPSVGTYLDEQPVTTIGGTLDVHIYDIARIESLAGPQGTLYGASSEAGTIRIITNKPELGVTTGRVDGELNTVAHGGVGGKLEGMINMPIAIGSPSAASPSTSMTRATSTMSSASAPMRRLLSEGEIKAASTDSTTAGSSRRTSTTDDLRRPCRAEDRPRRQLDRRCRSSCTRRPMRTASSGWTRAGDLKAAIRKEYRRTISGRPRSPIEGKIANFFDVTYAGAYMDRPRSSTSDYTDYTDLQQLLRIVRLASPTPRSTEN